MFGYRDNDNQQDERHQGPIHTEKIITERKIFFLDLKENNRGRFVKITEDVRGRRDTIMLPSEHIQDFLDALTAIRDADNEND
tara:strand:+ start:1728 stop:1976 length:249 start_codon:yes stop_codon:yes gene_type:complete